MFRSVSSRPAVHSLSPYLSLKLSDLILHQQHQRQPTSTIITKLVPAGLSFKCEGVQPPIYDLC